MAFSLYRRPVLERRDIMSFSSWLRTWIRSDRVQRRRARKATGPRVSHRPRLEALEDRTLLSNYTAATMTELIADINAANKAGGTNTIYLASATPTITPVVFDLTAVDNTTNGANGLPVISGTSAGKKVTVAADNLTIIGTDPGGDIIQRDPTSTTLALRLFDVAPGASLTLENVTLQHGLASGSGAAADGGAIYNQGTLTLQNTIVQNNTAQGSNGAPATFTQRNKFIAAGAGADAEGGGIWTNGTVELEGGTIIGSTDVSSSPLSGEGNKAIGGNGGYAHYSSSVVKSGAGGGGFGGGLYQAGGSVTMTNATVVGNVAAGGSAGFAADLIYGAVSGNGGAAAGGGLDVAGGTLLMSNDTVKTNLASGGNGGSGSVNLRCGTGGTGSGGGIYVGGGTVTLQAINLSSNQATGGWGGYRNHSDLGDPAAYYGLGGNGLGGGLCVGGGAVTMTGSTVNGNGTYAGFSGFVGVPNGSPGVASGGGISIVAPATVSLDAFTVTNTTQNYDSNWSGFSYIYTGDDIDGSYTLI
jgi:hypothetical protein